MTASQVSLIVATMDLKMIQSVVRAMRAADAAAIQTRPPLHPVERQAQVHRTPVEVPRPVVHRNRAYEVRPMDQFSPRAQVEPAAPPATPSPELHSRITPSPFVPPWKELPCVNRIPEVVVVKQTIVKTDVKHKGSLLNLVV